MANVHLELSPVKGRANTGSTMPSSDSVEYDSESQATTSSWVEVANIVAPTTNLFWFVAPSGGDVLVRFGPDPANAGGNGRRVPAGMVRDFAVTSANEKCAIKSAP